MGVDMLYAVEHTEDMNSGEHHYSTSQEAVSARRLLSQRFARWEVVMASAGIVALLAVLVLQLSPVVALAMSCAAAVVVIVAAVKAGAVIVAEVRVVRSQSRLR